MPQDIMDPFGLGLRPLDEETDDPFDLGLRPLDVTLPSTQTYSHPMARFGQKVLDFGQGLIDFPQDLYHYVDTLGKTGSKQFMEGDIGGGLSTVISPLTDLPKLTKSWWDRGITTDTPSGMPGFNIPREEAKAAGTEQLIGLTGLPAQRFQEAWQAGDYPRIAGQATGAALTMLLPHMVGRRGAHPIEPTIEPVRPIEAAPARPVEAGPVRDYTGQGTLDFGEPLRPKYTPPPDLPYRQESLPFDEPYQPSMNLGPFRDARNRFTRETPTWNLAGENPFVMPEEPFLPFTSETVRMEDFAPRPRAPIPEPVPTPEPVVAPPVERPAPVIPPNENIGDVRPIPIDRLSPAVRAQMEADGYFPSSVSGNNMIFRRRTGETGSFDPDIFNPLAWARSIRDRFVSEGGHEELPPNDAYRRVLMSIRDEDLTANLESLQVQLEQNLSRNEQREVNQRVGAIWDEVNRRNGIQSLEELPPPRAEVAQEFIPDPDQARRRPTYEEELAETDRLFDQLDPETSIEEWTNDLISEPVGEPEPRMKRTIPDLEAQFTVDQPEQPNLRMNYGGDLSSTLIEPRFANPVARDPRAYRPQYSGEYDALALRKRAEAIVRTLAEARKLEEAGDIETARQYRALAGQERARQVYGQVTQVDELSAKGRLAREVGDIETAERYDSKVEHILNEQAGQLKLKFDDQVRRRGIQIDKSNLPPDLIDHLKTTLANSKPTNVSHFYAESVLRETPSGAPGLEVRDVLPNLPPSDKYYSMVYRDPAGKAIARLEGTVNNGISSLVSDKRAGALYGKGVIEMLTKAVQVGMKFPNGSISKHTYNLLQGILRRLEESGFSDEAGSTPIFTDLPSAIGEGYQRFKQKVSEKYEKSGIGKGLSKPPKEAREEFSWLKEIMATASGLTTTGDLSAPLRQGLPLINTKQFWQAAQKMFGGLSKEGFEKIDAELRSKEIFQRPVVNGKETPSIADRAGLKLMEPATKVGPREETVAARYLETGEIIGKKAAPIWANTVGVPIRMSNRAYITFLNHLRANRFEVLMDRARDMALDTIEAGGQGRRPGVMGSLGFKKQYTPAEMVNLDPYHNMVLAREIGDFVNTATGRGPLKTHIGTKELNIESSANTLGHILFSPRLLASRVRMINPSTYMMASPFVRKQYLNAAVGAALGWGVFTGMSKVAAEAMGYDSEIVTDPTNSDFGKFRIGDTRLDFGGGFLQWATLLGRTAKGGWTSSSNPEEGMHEFGQGYQPETRFSNAVRFGVNKLNPAMKLAVDWAQASEGQPFQYGDRVMQMFVPLFAQDLIEMAQKKPEMLPWILPAAFGAGTQTYGKTRDYLGQGEGGTFISPENDIVFTGGNSFFR